MSDKSQHRPNQEADQEADQQKNQARPAQSRAVKDGNQIKEYIIGLFFESQIYNLK